MIHLLNKLVQVLGEDVGKQYVNRYSCLVCIQQERDELKKNWSVQKQGKKIASEAWGIFMVWKVQPVLIYISVKHRKEYL